MGKLENKYKSELKQRIESRFPGCFVLKNDEQQCQGIPDLTIYYGPWYAILEVKRSAQESFQPNQEHYLQMFNDMGGYAACIYPENEEEVLDEIQRAFGP